MRYFMELRYDGTAYCGWQRQVSSPSVQQTLESALSTLLRREIETTGAGRTDTGVHAAYYVTHFDVDSEIISTDDLCYHLNSVLPRDIAVMSLTRVDDSAHARFDAVRREYRYRIENEKNPFAVRSAWQYSGHLDLDAMNAAAARLLRYDDFTSFAKLNSNNKTNLCHIFEARWHKDESGAVFVFSADRFLRNMVRAVVGTLVDVGRGRLSVEQFDEIVAARDLSRSSGSAPAQGLFLYDILYPADVFIRKWRRNDSGPLAPLTLCDM